MKFKINNNTLKIEYDNKERVNSGSIADYLVPVDMDESWDGLTVVCKICDEKANTGIERSLIDNQVYIDMDKHKRYAIGFIGYTIENNVKVHQKSTNLVILPYIKGTGEVATTSEELPTTTEWELYIAQMQSITNTIDGLADDLEAQVTDVETKLANGDFDGADGKDGQDGITPTIGLNGNWFLGDVDTGKPSRGQNGINGQDGKDGKDGVNGQNGANGQDGYSPSASVNQISNGATITITDKNGTTTATVYNGITQDISGKLDTSKVKNTYSTTSGDIYDVTYINTMIGNIETLLSEV